jgi:protein-arginine kinase activator protein McsA
LGKYDQNKYLKKTKARVSHQCDLCNSTIESTDFYYAETQNDKFLHFLHAKCFCSKCYEKFGDRLLSIKRKRKESALESPSLENFF